MRTKLRKVILIVVGFLFIGVTTNAQNPFRVKANIIMQFDVSPNKQLICSSWFGGVDGISKIKVKNLKTQEVIEIDSIGLNEGMAFQGIAFLDNDQFIYTKKGALTLYNLKERSATHLLNLSNTVQHLTISKDKKGIYFVDYDSICYTDMKGIVQNKKEVTNMGMVMGISATTDNQIMYSYSTEKEKENSTQIWSWDGKKQTSNLTSQFSKKINSPYIVKTTSDPAIYVIANRDGIYYFEKSLQKATKLINSDQKDLIVDMVVSSDTKTIYYLTYYQRSIIKTLDMNGKQGETISF